MNKVNEYESVSDKYKNPMLKGVINGFVNSLDMMVKLSNAENALDAGCGEGYIFNRLFSKNKRLQMTGLDISNEALKTARKLNPDSKFFEGSIYEMPFEDNKFDLVIASEVLEHLEKPKKALDEISRISKKHVLLSVPNEPLFRITNFLRGKNISRLGNDIDHVSLWGKKQFINMISNYFKIVKIETPFPWIVVLCTK